MTNEWAVSETDDIQEIDEKKKPASDAAFKDTDKSGRLPRPGEGRGSSGEHETEPDKDKEAAP